MDLNDFNVRVDEFLDQLAAILAEPAGDEVTHDADMVNFEVNLEELRNSTVALIAQDPDTGAEAYGDLLAALDLAFETPSDDARQIVFAKLREVVAIGTTPVADPNEDLSEDPKNLTYEDWLKGVPEPHA